MTTIRLCQSGRAVNVASSVLDSDPPVGCGGGGDGVTDEDGDGRSS